MPHAFRHKFSHEFRPPNHFSIYKMYISTKINYTLKIFNILCCHVFFSKDNKKQPGEEQCARGAKDYREIEISF